MVASAVRLYVEKIKREHNSGIATEHAYRPALKDFVESVDYGKILAVNDPRRIKLGGPDLVVVRNEAPVAYMEAKDIGKNLDKWENNEQLIRYRKMFPNLILTDYLEFRWYLNGEIQRAETLGEAQRGKLKLYEAQYSKVEELLYTFVHQSHPIITSASQLARRMADNTREIASFIKNAISDSPHLKSAKEAIERILIPNLTNAQFADVYAQTIAYGLFAARIQYTGDAEGFTLERAFWAIPETHPFLKRLFQNIIPELDQSVKWLVETLTQLLAHTNTAKILEGFGQKTHKEDPVIHFYETFLSAYDPNLRESRGVYYTPEPVVSYMVRSIDIILKDHFQLTEGVADSRATILDPATGTGTFLYSTIQHIYQTRFQGQAGAWDNYVSSNLLPRVFGFELLMASYAVAHMKMGVLLKDTGYKFTSGQRLQIYLTNTLEENVKEKQAHLGFDKFIADEANAASSIKREKPIMVVLGNPPYSNFGQMNQGEWITKLMRAWKPEGEKKWNPDDLMKFIRFGQRRIEQTGQGVLAFITSSTYIDGITHRVMRQSLINTFSDIYILNLHGGIRRKETAPEGVKDENVFDIQQGVAIVLFVKDPNKTNIGKIRYAEIWGTREEKYDYLRTQDYKTIDWVEIIPNNPNYFFVPKASDSEEEYKSLYSTSSIFPIITSGFQTKRDKVAIAWSEEILKTTLEDFTKLPVEVLRQKYDLPADGRDWTISLASKHALEVLNKNNLTKCLYRPFDTRWTVIDNKSKGFVAYPRFDVMRNMLQSNIGLILTRQISLSTFQHAWVTTYPIDGNTISLQTREYNYLIPLYLYPDPTKPELGLEGDWPVGAMGQVPNLNIKFVREMERKLSLTFDPLGKGGEGLFTPEDVFHYAYAVFHSPTYRTRYAEFLKIDFPRLPITSNADLFRALATRGQCLVELHLLRGALKLATQFPERGSNKVEAGYPKYDNKRVYINTSQYFSGVKEATWKFHVGGYQVLEKWLKDRRGRTLNYEEIIHYQKVVVALDQTIKLMGEIDELIPSWPIC